VSSESGAYFRQPRDEVAALVEGTGLSVLELGCGEGMLGAGLKARGVAARVVGVEIDERSAAAARGRLDEVHVADLESFSFPYPGGTFDAIIAADVLEHVRDPWGLLGRLRPLLKPGGRVVASVPNVKYLPVLARLVLRDDFAYRDWGVLDRTHLRFFTARTARTMLERAGFTVERVVCKAPPSWKMRVLHAATLGLCPSFFAEQVLFVARKGPES
jgi:2-polyprenyl-3-methyl-5-hydroxy-6-metoxy-1,4-benzoquinol methylase